MYIGSVSHQFIEKVKEVQTDRDTEHWSGGESGQWRVEGTALPFLGLLVRLDVKAKEGKERGEKKRWALKRGSQIE